MAALLPLLGRLALALRWLRLAGAWPLPEALSPARGPWRSVGNHRYEIRIPPDAEPQAAYVVDLRWRRPDPDPAAKGTVLLDALTELPVARCRRLSATPEAGRFAFAGAPGGEYHLYFMPFETCEFDGGECCFGQEDDVEGMVQYAAFNESCRDEVWWEDGEAGEAQAGAQQSRTEFDAYGAMEQVASEEAAKALVDRAGGLLVAAQGRESPVRMLDHLPAAWTERPFESLAAFHGVAQPGEAYTFQVAVAADGPLTIERTLLSRPLAPAAGAAIPPSALRCLNLQGVDYWGRPFNSTVPLQAGRLAVLWYVLDVPDDVTAGVYNGTLAVSTSRGQRSVLLSLEVRGPRVANRGYDDLWRGARLAWLDSTLGNEDDVPPPFVPVSVAGRKVTLLDKVVEVSGDGLLASVQVGGAEALESAMSFEVRMQGAPVKVPMELFMEPAKNLTVAWRAKGAVAGVSVAVLGSLDATGYADFEIAVDAGSQHEVRLLLPNRAANAIYAAGLGRAGGFLRRWFNASLREPSPPMTWRWDGINGNNGIWVGSTKTGLRLFPKGDDPLWQAGVPYDSDKAPEDPQSWSNGKSGGVSIWPNGTVAAFTGPRAGGRQTYRFSVLATPTRPLDLPKHFAERYAQISGPANFTDLREGGATVVNVHQGNVLNPWINYPYLSSGLLKRAADECHALGMKLKVYNTMRELSNHALELWALRALNETYVWQEGQGGGGDWLREHLRHGYSVAWATPLPADGFWTQQIDMAIRVNAMSRWNNYYVEGLRQIVQDYGCDGIYLDEIAYDRVTMRRAKAVLGKDGLIDHHSDRGGFARVPVVNYMELFPFVDSLWYGEGFNYDEATPDHWLVEISGIPFGLPSDMLRYSGMTPFHFRGMLFASANRWQDNLGMRPGSSDAFDPRAIWALWDSFGIANATMYGWWLTEEGGGVPVAPNSSEVKCTTYARPGRGALIVLANFGKAQAVRLEYDWKVLGLEPEGLRLRAPALKPMQPAGRTWAVLDSIDVPAPERGSPTSREGWLLLLEPGAAGAEGADTPFFA